MELELRGITKRFGPLVANDGISLSVAPGQVHALLGENGAGKTTLMNVLYGLMQPDEGEIVVDGKPAVFHSPKDAIAAGIGMVHQHFMLVPVFTVAENVTLGIENEDPVRGAPGESSPRGFLSRAGLREEPPRRNVRAALVPGRMLLDFSTPIAEAVAPFCFPPGAEEIARCLATHPSYILLDEPFAGIDPIAVGEIRDLVKHLKDRGIGVLITDHNVRDALDVIDRAYILHDGQVLKEGTPSEIVADRDVRRVYLGEKFSL